MGLVNNRKEFLIQLDADKKSPLDLLVDRADFANEDQKFELANRVREIAQSLGPGVKVKMQQRTFEKLCLLLKHEKYSFYLRVIVEKTEFAVHSVVFTPMDFLLTSQDRDTLEFENGLFKELKTGADMFCFRLNADSFVNLCKRNDSHLFKLMADKCKFRLVKTIQTRLCECVDLFMSLKTQLDLLLVEYFFDFIRQEMGVEVLFPHVNQFIKISIEKEMFSLAEFAISYVNARFGYDETGLDLDSVKKLNERANVRSPLEESDCFGFDYKSSQSMSTSDNMGMSSVRLSSGVDSKFTTPEHSSRSSKFEFVEEEEEGDQFLPHTEKDIITNRAISTEAFSSDQYVAENRKTILQLVEIEKDALVLEDSKVEQICLSKECVIVTYVDFFSC